jgi:signal transduction histidine kinase
VTETALPTLSAALCQLIAAVLAQATGGDCASLARVAAEETMARIRAQAVSVLCVSGGLINARAGEWPSAARPKLDAWERALVKRARQGATDLPGGPIPISVAQVSGWTLCMAPLAAGRQAVGALSLCMEPPREKEATRAAQDLSPWLGAILGLAQGTVTVNWRLAALGQILRSQAGPDGADAKTWLRKVLRLYAEVFQAQGGLVVALSDTGEHLRCLAADVPNEALDWTGARFKASGLLHHVCISREAIFSNDPASDLRYAPDVEGALVEPLQSILAVPMDTLEGGRGALALLNSRDALGFAASDAGLLAGVAVYVSTTLQNSGLRRSAAENTEQMAAVQRSLRAEIAGTMHQGAIQMLAAVTMGLDHLEHLVAVQPDALAAEIKSLKELTREASRESRLLLFELHPASLESEGLAATLEAYTQQMPGGGENVRFQQRGPIERLDASVAESAFHATVQGLRHARLHGHAAHVWLSVSLADEVLSIIIEDDGRPATERRCTTHEEALDCPAYISQQLALVRGTLEVRVGGLGDKPALLIRIPALVH